MGGIFLFGAQTVEPERWVSGVPPEFLLWVPQMLGAGSRVVPPEAGGKGLEICPGAGVEELAAAGRGAEGTPTPPGLPARLALLQPRIFAGCWSKWCLPTANSCPLGTHEWDLIWE